MHWDVYPPKKCLSKRQKRAYGTPDSHVVPHRSTDRACSGLTAQFGRDTVLFTEYGRRRMLAAGRRYIYSMFIGHKLCDKAQRYCAVEYPYISTRASVRGRRMDGWTRAAGGAPARVHQPLRSEVHHAGGQCWRRWSLAQRYCLQCLRGQLMRLPSRTL